MTALVVLAAWLGVACLATAWYALRAPRGAAHKIAIHKTDEKEHRHV